MLLEVKDKQDVRTQFTIDKMKVYKIRTRVNPTKFIQLKRRNPHGPERKNHGTGTQIT